MRYTQIAIQICERTALSLVPKKRLIRRFCLIHLGLGVRLTFVTKRLSEKWKD